MRSHELIRKLAAEDVVHGVRVDHVDGLLDPLALSSATAFRARVGINRRARGWSSRKCSIPRNGSAALAG